MTVSSLPKLLAITQGDPAGIGPEIIAKAFRDAPERLQGCFAVGDVATLRRAAQLLQGPGRCALPVAVIAAPQEALHVPPRCLPVFPLPGLPGPLPFGQVQAEAGRAAAACVQWAARAALRGEIDGRVTAPLHKEALHLAGVDFPGHTELLQAEADWFRNRHINTMRDETVTRHHRFSPFRRLDVSSSSILRFL